MKLPRFKTLSIDRIVQSKEILEWLEQFPDDRKNVAIDLLSKLRFVSRDDYAEWIMEKIENEFFSRPIALYSIAKPTGRKQLWGENGEIKSRPGGSLGSEDLVSSIVSQIEKKASRTTENVFDHPDLETLRTHKIHDIVLIDDSIGSGKRVIDYVSAFLGHRTTMSWWSYGLLHLHVVTLVSNLEAEKKIVKKIPGSDHGARKYRKSEKIFFHKGITFSSKNLEAYWGNQYKEIVDLCKSLKVIPKDRQLGFNGVMSNIVFRHSVPNNIPGLLYWDENGKWKPLFPGRSFPVWLGRVLDEEIPTTESDLMKAMIFDLVAAAGKGVRSKTGLSIRLGLDTKIVDELLSQTVNLGFMNANLRLTKTGYDFLKSTGAKRTSEVSKPFDETLYIPLKWSPDRFDIQPSSPYGIAPSDETNPESVSAPRDGEIGEISLERTDARTTTSSKGIVFQTPSGPRKEHDTFGPTGLEES